MEADKIINGNCWVACIDLLGFKKELLGFEKQSGVGMLDIFVESFYKEILEIFQKDVKDFKGGVFACWASDTFVFYTPDDSDASFSTISIVANNFCCRMIWHQKAFRGALGTGQFYADRQNNIFLGSAFIDAYEYAEKQNWIGFVVTPTAEKKIGDIDIELSLNIQPHISLYQYSQYDVPIKEKELRNSVEGTERLFAAKIPDARESFRMPSGLPQEVMVKYENTLRFFEQCPCP